MILQKISKITHRNLMLHKKIYERNKKKNMILNMCSMIIHMCEILVFD